MILLWKSNEESVHDFFEFERVILEDKNSSMEIEENEVKVNEILLKNTFDIYKNKQNILFNIPEN